MVTFVCLYYVDLENRGVEPASNVRPASTYTRVHSGARLRMGN